MLNTGCREKNHKENEVHIKMDPQHNSNEIVHRNNSQSNEYLVSWAQSELLTWMLSFDVHTACEMGLVISHLTQEDTEVKQLAQCHTVGKW